jgi:hypothetical protein
VDPFSNKKYASMLPLGQPMVGLVACLARRENRKLELEGTAASTLAERVVADSFYGLAGEEDDTIATFTGSC